MDLTSVALLKEDFYRILGVSSDDDFLTSQGEAVDDVAYLFLTRGMRAAQRWMLKCGYKGWRVRSPALSFSGSDDADGGQSTDLPTDFLRAAGSNRVSCLREANGNPWGQQTDDEMLRGNGFYFLEPKIWLSRGAIPPTTLYLHYHQQHEVITAVLADADIDFPLEARSLIVAEGAYSAKDEDWLPGGPELEEKVTNALKTARESARDIARPSRQPRTFQKPRRFGTRY